MKATLSHPPSDPWGLFESWYEEALECEAIRYAAAMCLSTVDLDGSPDGRTVLLKSFDSTGFVFFTDAESTKGQALAQCPQAALTFYWGPLERQIRLRGRVETASDRVSDECFRRRPRGSQLTAWASQQSRPLVDRGELQQRLAHFAEKFEGLEVLPRPPHWQAYRLLPRAVEFWQAKASRLHDRLLYTQAAGGQWHREWLYP